MIHKSFFFKIRFPSTLFPLNSLWVLFGLLMYFTNQLTHVISVLIKPTLRFLGGLKLKNVYR